MMNRWLWICIGLALLLSFVVWFAWGWSWASVLVIVFVMVCPAIMIWGALQIRKPRSTDVNIHVDGSGD